jgi:hypothetical protein
MGNNLPISLCVSLHGDINQTGSRLPGFFVLIFFAFFEVQLPWTKRTGMQ